MYLVRLTVDDFVRRAPALWEELSDRFKLVHGQKPGPSEVTSWKNSLPALARVLDRPVSSMRTCTIYLEYGMPGSSTRADVVLAGLDARGYRSAVVVELKQWDARSIVIDGHNVRVGGQLHPHPSEQALGYRDFLADLAPAFADVPKTIRSCCYLHNALSYAVDPLREGPFAKLTELSPLFAATDDDAMARWLSEALVEPADSLYLAALDSDAVSVSKTLFENVAKAVREEPAWVLLDEQLTAYHEIIDLATRDDGEKHLVLVTGGPGTGKSVIAMQLMGELSRRHIPTVHVTNSSSFTTVMKALIVQKRGSLWGTRAVEALFRLSHAWVKRPDDFEVAICDEAHRFRTKTTLFPYVMSNRPQAEEIMEHVRIFVAFLDEQQRLRVAEEGTDAYFRACAHKVGILPENIHGPIELVAQFRATGNSDFVHALDAALYQELPIGFVHNNFEVKIHSSVDAMERHLEDKLAAGYSARLVAGFCWPWSDPDHDGALVPDVKIGTWQRPWNRKAVGSYPPEKHPYTLWANRKNDQLGEVGCIYSAQGFEFDYVGVIWANDLVWRDGRWVAQPNMSHDSELRPAKRKPLLPDDALPLLKNAYRVLCSRGMRGCSIFCTDQETAEYLKQALDSDHAIVPSLE